MTEANKASASKVGHRWGKGQSGNPGGRPKMPKDALELANAACPEAIRKAIELLNHGDPRVRLKAIELVLDRGLGKPKQAVDVTDLTERPAIVWPEPLSLEAWAAKFGPNTEVMGHGD